MAGAMKPYIDEPAGMAAGAALRLLLARRIAVRPEFVSASSTYYSNLMGIASITADVTDPGKAVTGYVVAGGGGNQIREKPIHYSSTRAQWLAGAGLRFGGRSRWIGGAEFRIGNAAFPLVTFYAGVRFGRNLQ
jgi:hypothetical protein